MKTFKLLLLFLFMTIISICKSQELTCTVSINSSPRCSGHSGELNANRSGGTPPYTYAWNDIEKQQMQTPSLIAGTYTVTVMDENDLTTTCSVTLSEPTPLVITMDNMINESTDGQCDGSIEVTTNGGTLNISPLYLWDGMSAFGETSEDITALCSDTYSVTATDDNGCTATLSMFLDVNTSIVERSTGPSRITAVYDLLGRRVNRAAKGRLYIVKTSDGRTSKRVILD